MSTEKSPLPKLSPGDTFAPSAYFAEPSFHWVPCPDWLYAHPQLIRQEWRDCYLFLVLKAHGSDHCRISVPQLAASLGVQRSTARTYLAGLETLGLIRPVGEPGRTSVYYFTYQPDLMGPQEQGMHHAKGR